MSKNKGFIQITGHVYKVKNQNGFNNALYHYFGATDNGEGRNYTKKEVRKMVENWPKIYPTCIVIVDNSFNCARVYVECF